MAKKSLNVLALDPGKWGDGVAYFSGGQLQKAWYVPNQDLVTTVATLPFDVLVAEVPQVYPKWQAGHYKLKGDPNHLIPLAVKVGYWSARAKELVYTYPCTWTGRVSKENRHKLLTADADLMAKVHEHRKTLQHNVLDAAGIGLWWLQCATHDQWIPTKKKNG